MDSVFRQSRKTVVRLAAVAGLSLGAACGCASSEKFWHTDDQPVVSAAHHVVATWNRDVVSAPDPTRNGAPTPGLLGRVYLFGPEIGTPLAGDGTLFVDLYDDSVPTGPGGKPPPLIERWAIDKDTLQKLLRRDRIGWGYTVFLPWGTYRPDLQQVRLQVRYEPPKGSPLFSDNTPLRLNHEALAGRPSASYSATVQTVAGFGTPPAPPPAQGPSLTPPPAVPTTRVK